MLKCLALAAYADLIVSLWHLGHVIPGECQLHSNRFCFDWHVSYTLNSALSRGFLAQLMMPPLFLLSPDWTCCRLHYLICTLAIHNNYQVSALCCCLLVQYKIAQAGHPCQEDKNSKMFLSITYSVNFQTLVVGCDAFQ